MRIGNTFYVAAASLIVAVGALVALNVTGTSSQAMSSYQNCKANDGTDDAIIDCGALTQSELLQKYDANARDVQGVYTHYGISRGDLAGELKVGTVTRDGNVYVDGKVVATGAYSVSRIKFTSQGEPNPVTINGTTYYEGPSMMLFSGSVDAFVIFKNGQFYKAVLSSCGNPLVATPETPTPKPVYSCDGLTATKIERNKFEFTSAASAKDGASVVSYNYDFGDGVKQSNASKTVEHIYNTDVAKTYTATMTVNIKVGDKTVTQDGTKCKAVVEVTKKPVENKPSIDITKTVNGKEHDKVAVNTEFTYQITVRNTGNVVLKNAVVIDKAPKEVTLLSAAVGTITNNEWKYTIPELKVGESKTFMIKAKYAKYASGTHKNTVCVDTPTVPGSPDDCDEATTETHEKITVCDLNDNTIKTIEKSAFDSTHMTTDTSKCGQMKVCIIESKTIKVIAKKDYNTSTMTTDMTKCEETVVTPPELPKTGLESFIGGGLGLGSIIAAGNYWFASRKNLLSALLNK